MLYACDVLRKCGYMGLLESSGPCFGEVSVKMPTSPAQKQSCRAAKRCSNLRPVGSKWSCGSRQGRVHSERVDPRCSRGSGWHSGSRTLRIYNTSTIQKLHQYLLRSCKLIESIYLLRRGVREWVGRGAWLCTSVLIHYLFIFMSMYLCTC